MTNIYLIRHANAVERKDTQRASLTEYGVKQAELLAERLKNHDIHVFYSSSYLRSRRTAEIIAKPHKQKILEAKAELTEVDFRIKRRLSLGSFKELKNFYDKTEIEQIKNLLKAQKKALRMIKFLFESHLDQNVVVITHGNIIKAIILGLLMLKLARFHRFVISEASLSRISGTSIDDARIFTINDMAHLEK